MVTHFITFEVSLQPSAAELQRLILKQLQQQGEPLRWAIVAVDVDRRTATIEAVVTTLTELLIPAASVRTI